MRFRVKLVMAAHPTALVGGVLKAALFDAVVWSGTAVVLVLVDFAVAMGLARLAETAGHRVWKPTRETVRLGPGPDARDGPVLQTTP